MPRYPKKPTAKKVAAKKKAAPATKRVPKKGAKAKARPNARQKDQRAADALRAQRLASASAVSAAEFGHLVHDAPAPRKPSLLHRFRCAITGLFVPRKHAQANPTTTVREKAD